MFRLKAHPLQLVVFPLVMLLPRRVLLLLHLKDFRERGALQVRRELVLSVKVLDFNHKQKSKSGIGGVSIQSLPVATHSRLGRGISRGGHRRRGLRRTGVRWCLGGRGCLRDGKGKGQVRYSNPRTACSSYRIGPSSVKHRSVSSRREERGRVSLTAVSTASVPGLSAG